MLEKKSRAELDSGKTEAAPVSSRAYAATSTEDGPALPRVLQKSRC